MSNDPRIGTQLAGFRIEELIGHGGMGVVYRATQLSLGRRVALKVLASHLAHDESFRERFEFEWRTAAGLEHPNIVPIYEAGEADGVLYIAMRYVDGTDLGAVLATEHRLEPARAISILGQVALALDAAHSQDLVHRDVKPGNILVAAGGSDESEHVYLTDFGVAKQARAKGGLTRTGFFVGTIEYAPPEQIEGKELDGRADVYALGCVLYQCLTGAPPFEKDAEVATLYAHLLEPPPSVIERRPELSPAIDDVIGCALAKKPEERYGTCRQLVRAAREGLGVSGEAPVPKPAAPTRVEPATAGAAATVAGTAAAPLTPPTTPAGAAPPTGGTVPPAAASAGAGPGGPSPGPPPSSPWRSRRRLLLIGAAVLALAGAGAGAAIGLSGGGGGETGAESTNDPPTTEGPTTEGPTTDGTTDGGTTDGTTPPPAGGGAIVFDSERDGDGEIYVMGIDGANRVRLTNDKAVDAAAKWSPDGTQIAFWSDRDGDADIYVMNADGTGVQQLTTNGVNDYNPAWSADGERIAFEREGGNQYDIWTMSATGGDEVQLTTGDAYDASAAYSPDGTTIAFTSDRDGDNEIFLMNVDGTDQRALTDNDRSDDYAAWSSDGATIAFSAAPEDSTWDIWLMDADGANQRQVSTGPRDDVIPSFTGDAAQLVFESNQGGDYEIWIMNADGSDARALTDDFTQDFQPNVSSAAAVPTAQSDTPFLTDPSAYPTRREAELLTHIDAATRETCEREARGTIANKAIAGVACTSGKFNVFYDLFRTKATMNEYYDGFARYSDGQPFPRGEGDCKSSDVAEGTWERDDTVAGRRTCYDTSDDFRVIVWTDDALKVVGFATVKPADREALVRFWNSKKAQLIP